MGRIKTIAAGILLGVGLPISILATFSLADQNASPDSKNGALGALVMFGLAPVSLGSWLILSNSRGSQQAERDRLQAVFYKLLQEGNGHINALRFSMEAKLGGAEAKAYLDDRAKEFNAAYNVSEEGKLSYYFDGELNQLPLTPSLNPEAYDVILESVPDNHREVVRVLHELTGLEWQQAKSLVKGKPSYTIAKSVNKTTAEQFRAQLQAVGARVLVVLR